MCIVTHFPKYFILYGASAVMFQTCLFSLTLLKFIAALREGWSDVPLLVLIARDGTWAYLLAVVIILGDVSMYALKNASFGGVLYGWMITALSFSGDRILLNLARSVREDQHISIRSPMRFGWETCEGEG